MAQLVEFELEDGGGTLVVQAADIDSGEVDLASAADHLKPAAESLEAAIDKVTPALKSIAGKLKKVFPDGATVELGLALSAESGVILAKAGGEAHLNVTLNWGAGKE